MKQRITRSRDGEATSPSPSSQFKASNGTGPSSSALAQSVRPSGATPTSMYPGGAMPCPTRSSGAGVGTAGRAMTGHRASGSGRGACAMAATSTRQRGHRGFQTLEHAPRHRELSSDNALIVGLTYIVGADRGRAGCVAPASAVPA